MTTRPIGRRKLLAVGIGAMLIAVPLVGVALNASGSPATARSTAGARTGEVATVERRDLVDRESVGGTLGYGKEVDVPGTGSGTVTALPPLGAAVSRGEMLVEIDGRPVPLFYGTRPMWRSLSAGVDDGPDVAQLKENLVALGFATTFQVGTDKKFSPATTAAIKRWQHARDVTESGVFTPGDVVVAPGAVRISKYDVAIGAQAGPGTPIVSATGTTKLVTVEIAADRVALAQAGAKVRVVLSDGTSVDATILAVAKVATADIEKDPNAAPKITVTIVFDDPTKAGSLDETPVTVEFTKSSAKGVTAVPVRALLALSEGGYAVEVIDGPRRKVVPVKVGSFADGYVGIEGAVQPGDKIVMPR